MVADIFLLTIYKKMLSYVWKYSKDIVVLTFSSVGETRAGLFFSAVPWGKVD
jgi:hypothetical protein